MGVAVEDSRQRYEADLGFRRSIGFAARAAGITVDVGTGPRSSFCGALVPLLRPDTHLVMNDVALGVLRRLRTLWSKLPHSTTIHYFAFDMHLMPFRPASVSCVTSNGGFENANADPRRRLPPGAGTPYEEAFRILKSGGVLLEGCRAYAPGSRTADYLGSLGYPNATGERLESFWETIGFRIVSRHTVKEWRGKADPEDWAPVGAEDKWREMLYVLKKP